MTEDLNKVANGGRLVLGNTLFTKQPRTNKIYSSDGHETSKDDSIGADTVVYLTRHNIDKASQTHGLCREVLFDECLPCCNTKKIQQQVNGAGIAVLFTWSILRSEMFIFTLHIVSILMGAVKEGTSLRSGHAQFAFAVTCVETSATLAVVLVRMGNAYAGYRMARSTVRHDENFNPDTDLHVKLLRCWLLMFEAIGLLLFAFSLTCLLVFHFHYHVGWTILSNNISMITILAMSTLYSTRVISTVSRIREDQYKLSPAILELLPIPTFPGYRASMTKCEILRKFKMTAPAILKSGNVCTSVRMKLTEYATKFTRIHPVVIYEAASLIEETYELMKRKVSTTDTNDQSNDADLSSKGMIFVRALRSTKLLERPHYIKVANQTSEKFDSLE